MIPCAYDGCLSNLVSSLNYKYGPVCFTYELLCRSCGRRFATSFNLEVIADGELKKLLKRNAPGRV